MEDRKGGAAPRAGPGDQGPARRPRGPEARASLGSKRQSAAGPSLSRSGQSPTSLEEGPLKAKGGDATRPQEESELGPGGDTLSLCHLYPNPPSLVHGVHRKWLPPAPASTYYNPATGRHGPLLLVLVPYSQDGASGWVSWDQVPAPPWPEGRVAEHRHGQSSQADIPACISNESP